MDIFEAVADPHRRTLLDLLAEDGRSAGELVVALPSLAQPAISRHLRVLREAGLVGASPRRSDASTPSSPRASLSSRPG